MKQTESVSESAREVIKENIYEIKNMKIIKECGLLGYNAV
jgi:hypothetical protein